uniref:T9SS C-terminal target domain-containing protein n=1 Tax=Tenacibaculum sp. 47A_GOM-205m TaxID=1380384 RepID=UPI00049158AE
NTTTGTYTFTPDAGECVTATDVDFTLTVTPEPSAVVTDVTICLDETYTWSVNNVEYNGADGSQTVTIEGADCAADQVLNITVRNVLEPTGVVVQSFCSIDNPTVADLRATGTDIQWYATVTGGMALGTTEALVDGNTYYASQTEGSCESTKRLEVKVRINSVPTVNSQSTNNTTPVIEGTADSVDTITVTVNGVMYSEGDGNLVDNSNDTWTLNIPVGNEIFEGTYDVIVNNGVCSDITADELVINTTLPVLTITIDDITDDNIINSVEAGSNITVTGTVAGDFKVGDIVTLIINGNNYTGLVDSSGNFSISVPGVELVLDIDTTVEANVSSTDGEGNRGSANAEQKYFLQDTDRDGIADVIDVDDDNDGIPDVEEGDGLVDTDGDGIPDSLDLDSDNDGINDVIEGGNGDLDTNGDGYIDVQDSGYSDTNGDGQADASVDEEEEPDTDGDTIPDYRDLDSDNDGINDVIEGGNEEFDTNGDGVINSEDIGGSDLDGDGISDSVDGDTTKFGEGNGGNEGTIDSDGDTIPDYRDLDSDNDGVNDVVEGGNSDTDGDGQVDNPFDDSDGDGIADSVDDLDGFGDANNPDYNSNPTDPTDGGNGVVDGDDSDGDGIPNPVDGLDGFGDANNDDTCVKVNNLMSPNGDPANNYLHIDCIENFPRNTIEIFNRWGNTVFKMEGYSNNNQDKRFEGISNGRANINVNDKLPVGTYFYILDLGNGSKVKKGWIYINR